MGTGKKMTDCGAAVARGWTRGGPSGRTMSGGRADPRGKTTYHFLLSSFFLGVEMETCRTVLSHQPRFFNVIVIISPGWTYSFLD
jgi:hypothetical protein